MRLLITGAAGQLGQELLRQAAGQGELDVQAVDRSVLDISSADAVSQGIAELAPDVVINAAAYTAVDRAESEPERAHAVNVDGPRHLAKACAAAGAQLIHVSTDFVFDGESSQPYAPDAASNPLSVYGRSKRDGERAVQAALPQATLVRTAWVYGPGGQNFVTTMLRLMAEREELGVVMDQIGCPTSTRSLAAGLLGLLQRPAPGRILHHTDAGVASWYDFACAIRELAEQQQPQRAWARVKPIYTVDYPTPARRPRFSLLDCRGDNGLPVERQHWRTALAQVWDELQPAV